MNDIILIVNLIFKLKDPIFIFMKAILSAISLLLLCTSLYSQDGWIVDIPCEPYCDERISMSPISILEGKDSSIYALYNRRSQLLEEAYILVVKFDNDGDIIWNEHFPYDWVLLGESARRFSFINEDRLGILYYNRRDSSSRIQIISTDGLEEDNISYEDLAIFEFISDGVSTYLGTPFDEFRISELKDDYSVKGILKDTLPTDCSYALGTISDSKIYVQDGFGASLSDSSCVQVIDTSGLLLKRERFYEEEGAPFCGAGISVNSEEKFFCVHAVLQN